MNTLVRLNEMVVELNTTNSSNEKKEILAKYGDLKSILNIIYSDFYQFGVTSENYLKLKTQLELEGDNPIRIASSLEALLKKLYTREVTGHTAIRAILGFIGTNQNYQELILNIIDKNLKCRIDSSLINKVFPDSIQVFDVALAKDINKVTKKPNYTNELWFGSRKLDGLRTIVIKEGDSVRAYSRTGKEFTTLQVVLDEIRLLPIANAVFDGELCLIDEAGKEDFQNIMKEIRKKDHTILNPKYNIFDCLTLDEFASKSGKTTLATRFGELAVIFDDVKLLKTPVPHLAVLEQTVIHTSLDVDDLVAEAKDKGWEGIMLRKNTGYEGKRTSNLLKVKSFFDAEYTVTGIETGLFRVIEEGKEVEIQTLSNVYIEHKGYKVSVGSGFSLEERKHFYNNPNDIVGKSITVKYFEETKNQDGGISLRFPTCKAIHGREREV